MTGSVPTTTTRVMVGTLRFAHPTGAVDQLVGMT